MPIFKILIDLDENQEDMDTSSQQLKLIRIVADLHTANLLRFLVILLHHYLHQVYVIALLSLTAFFLRDLLFYYHCDRVTILEVTLLSTWDDCLLWEFGQLAFCFGLIYLRNELKYKVGVELFRGF